MNNPPPFQPPADNLHDSWSPADKAAEAVVENPAEFEPRPATKSSTGPVLEEDELPLKTHGDPAVDRIEK